MPNFEDPESLATVLRKYMKLAGVGTSRLAQISGVAEPTIKHWWNGRVRHTRDWQNLVRVAAALKLDADAASTLLQAAGQPSIPYLLDHVLDSADQALLAPWATSASTTNPAVAQPLDLVDALQELHALPINRLPETRPMPIGSRIILSRNPLFVGREGDLHALAAAIKASTTTAISHTSIAATTGIGGIGKTQLASEFVHRYGQYFAGGVFWMSFADPKAVAVEIAACGGGGGMNLRPDYHMLPLEEQVQLVRAAWQSPIPRLLIFDNCEDESLLEQWRPPTGGCRILVTSRRTEWDIVLNVQTLSIDVLRREESITLLRKHRPDLAEDDPTLDAIAAELGDLPLALHLAGSYLARYRNATTPEAYLLALRSPPLLTHPSLLEGGLSPTRHDQHVARTFAISYQRLDAAHPVDALAIAILARVAYFAPGEPIPADLLVMTLPIPYTDARIRLRMEDALARLTELGLLERQEHQAFRLHRLLSSFVTMQCPDPTAEVAVEQMLLERVQFFNQKSLFPPVLPWQQHVRSVTRRAQARRDEAGADLCIATGNHLWIVGDSVDALEFFSAALAIYQEQLGPIHVKTIDTIEWLGLIHQLQGKLDQARALFQQVLVTRQQQLGTDHLDTATTHNNLGALLRTQGHLTEAEAHLRRGLTIRRHMLGLKNSHTARSLNNLAYVLYSMAEYSKARRYYKLALAIRQKLLDPNHLATAQSLNNLGEVLCCLGDYEAAWNYHQQALAMRLHVVGDRHFDTAESFWNLGVVCYYQAQYREAKGYLEQGLTIYGQLTGETPILKIQILTSLACTLRDQGCYTEAQSYFEQSLAAGKKYLGDNHTEVGNVLDGFGVLLLRQGLLSESQAHLERAFAIFTKVLGKFHPETARSLYHLGMLMEAQADWEGARSAYRQAVTVFRQRIGQNHPQTQQAKARLAALE